MSSSAAVLADVAGRHRSGLAILRELEGRGVSRFAAARLVTAGLAARYAPGVLSPTSRVAPVNQPLWVPQRYHEQVASGVAAPLLTGATGLLLRRVDEISQPPLPVVRWQRAPRMGQRPWCDVRGRCHTETTQIVEGLRCAGVAVCLADYAADRALGGKALRVAVDAVRWADRAALHELVACWGVLDGHVGARRLLSLYTTGVLDQESEGERAAWRDVFLPSGPPPDCQVWVTGRRRVDFVFLAAALVIEYLGKVHERHMEDDIVRHLELDQAGYDLIPLSRSVLRQDLVGFARHVQRRRREREDLARRGLLRVAPLPVPPSRRIPLTTLAPLG